MSGPQRKPLATVDTVTPTLNDKAIISQVGNTVKSSTLQSIYNLFKTGFDTVYATIAQLSNYVTTSQLSTTLTTLPQVASVTINNASVGILNTLPIQIVPSPGVGKAIQVLSCTVSFENTQSDDYQSNLQLQLIDGFSSDAIALSRADFLGGVSATYSQYLTIQQGTSQLSDQIIDNSNVKLSIVGGDPTPNGTPDVTLKVYVVYQIVTL